MSEKRNYWLKLKEDFFSQPYIKKLRKIAGGDTYTIIYQKILLLSVKTNGYLIFEGIEKTFEEELALILDEDVDNVKITLEFMKSNRLIETTENQGEFFIPAMLALIGSESESAKWVRNYRERKRLELLNSKNDKTLQCKAYVRECNDDVRECKENVIIDKDIDIDIDKDIDKYIDSKTDVHPSGEVPPSKPDESVIEILDYLNKKTDKLFSVKNKNNLKNIRARLNEGFTVEQLKTVIDKKTKEWINDPKMNEFLNPETLFRPNHFEKYLNAGVSAGIKKDKEPDNNNIYKNIKTTHIDNVTGEIWVTGG